MRMEAPDLKQEKERIVREDLESGISGGISEEKADQLYKVTETIETREENVARLREEALKAVDTAQIVNDTPVTETFPPAMTQEAPTKKSLKDRFLSFFGQAPEQLSSKYSKMGEERMRANPALRSAYEKFLATEGEIVAEKYKEAIGKYTYIARDKEGNFVDKTVYSVASGENPEVM